MHRRRRRHKQRRTREAALQAAEPGRQRARRDTRGAVFKKVWAVVSDEEEAPEATSPEHSTKEVLVAAVIHGAVFAGVKAAVDRAGAKGFKKLTGTDLGT